MNIALTAEQKTVLASPKEGYCLVQKALLQENAEDRQKEHFWVLGLTRNHTVLFLERLSLGNVRLDVQPANVFRFSLEKNAANIMLMHSHPASPDKTSIGDNDIRAFNSRRANPRHRSAGLFCHHQHGLSQLQRK